MNEAQQQAVQSRQQRKEIELKHSIDSITFKRNMRMIAIEAACKTPTTDMIKTANDIFDFLTKDGDIQLPSQTLDLI
jgi:hypothetical protein